MPANRITNAFGTWDFVEIKGHPDLPGQELKAIEKDGVDGVAFKEMQFSADPTPLYLKALAVSPADLLLWIANMKNLQGTQATLYTSTGVLYTGIIIRKSTHNSTKYLHAALWNGAVVSPAYEVQFQMTVQYPYGSF